MVMCVGWTKVVVMAGEDEDAIDRDDNRLVRSSFSLFILCIGSDSAC